MSIITIFTILSVISIVCVALVGVMLLCIRIAPRVNCEIYKKVKIMLAIMMIFGSVGRMIWLLGDDNVICADVFSGLILVICQFKACMFAFLILILIQSRYVTFKNILKNITPTVLFILLYIGITHFTPDKVIFSLNDFELNLPLILRTCFAVTFVIQLIVYVKLFLKERRLSMELHDDCFSELRRNDVLWASTLFWQATIVGGIITLYLIFPNTATAFFIELYVLVLYLIFGVSFINYQNGVGSSMMHDNEIDAKGDNIESKDCVKDFLNTSSLFLKQGVVVADYANQLNISDRKLSLFIKTEYGCNFNYWINTRRIEFACSNLDQNPHLTIENLAQDIGFSDKSNFSKSFKKIKGISFVEYKKDKEK